MDWILDHLQILIAVAGAIAYWLNARTKDKAGQPADYDGDGQPDNVPGGSRTMREQERAQEHEENTRRIQEEIRRKIAERRGGVPELPARPTPTTVAPPPMPDYRREAEERQRQERLREARRAEERRAAAESEAASVLERQRALAEKLEALQARRSEAQREAGAVTTASRAGAAGGQAGARARVRERDDADLLAELRNARSLRRAIILREVLGTPAGLK